MGAVSYPSYPTQHRKSTKNNNDSTSHPALCMTTQSSSSECGRQRHNKHDLLQFKYKVINTLEESARSGGGGGVLKIA